MLGVLGLGLLVTGCHWNQPRGSIAATEPPLAVGPDGSTVVAGAPETRAVTFVDRHPLFYKPRDIYETSGNNKVVKTAAAAFVGIPVGVFGELKQIVVGQPAPHY